LIKQQTLQIGQWNCFSVISQLNSFHNEIQLLNIFHPVSQQTKMLNISGERDDHW